MPAYLRHKPTGDLYIATALLLERTDMEEITAKQAAGVKSAKTREAKLALATEKAGEPDKKTATKKTSKKKANTSAEEAEASALAEQENSTAKAK